MDATRALAALAVLLTHWSQFVFGVPDESVATVVHGWSRVFGAVFWASRGIHPGVVVFIVLSGFCIHLPQARGDELAPGFWKIYVRRRALRILPVYWTGVGLGLLAAMIAAEQFSWRDLLGRFAMANAVHPWAPIGNPPLNTVAAEVALYAAYPLLLFLRARWGWRAVFGLSAALQGVSMAALLAGWDPQWVGASAPTFHLYWAAGAYAAERFARGSDASRARPWSIVVFAGYLAFSWLVRFKGSHMISTIILAAASARCLFEMMVTERKRRGAPGLRPLAWLGERSYSLYAAHFPIMILAWVTLTHRARTAAHANEASIIVLAAALVSMLLLYASVERPAHALAKATGSALAPTQSAIPPA